MTDRNATGRTLHFRHALLPGGWAENARFTLSGGLIAAIETDVAASGADERHGALMPGLCNLHSHAFQRAMAGLAEVRHANADSFWTWREAMYRFLDRLTPDDVMAIAAMAQVEMLETGFTRVGEFHYLHHAPDGAPYANPAAMAQAIAGAACETGIALTLLPVFYAHAGFGGAPPLPGQRRFLHDTDSFFRLLEHCRDALSPLPDPVLGLAAHSLRAVTPDELAALAGMADAGPIHIHIAEQILEVDDCIAWSGQRPVEWLLQHMPVDGRWCLVHATHVTAGELAGIASAGAVVGLCPITEANLGDGLFPAAGFAEIGGSHGIGTDSNVLIDATEELRLLEYGQRLSRRARNLMARGPGHSTGGDLFAAALQGGAQALGAAAGQGVGLPFDGFSLDTRHPSLAGRPASAFTDSLVFAAGRAAIATVWRRGEAVVTGGRHVRRDAVAARYRRVLEALLA